ncbi:MAG: HAMP domain-containing protein [Gemmatimonadota bacterium]|nr:MAG: HAMP domain-containing protein [Gemmatimonadota bacterium]
MRLRIFLSLSGLAVLTLVLYALLARSVTGPAAVTLVTSTLLAGGLAHLLSRPVRKLATFTELVSHGKLPARLPETAAGEIGDLYRAMNRVAEALREGLAQLGVEKSETEVLLREMGEGVLALDALGRVVRTNAELSKIIGAPEVVGGRSAAAVFRNPELIEFLSPQSMPEQGRDGEFEVFGRTMLVTARRLPAGGVVAVFADLTEMRRLDTIRTEFVANASHELKTPLTAIRGFAETLLTPDIPERDRETFASRIVEHAERMGAIVDDLLTLARLEDPGYTVYHETVSLAPLVEGIVSAFAERIRAAGISTAIEIAPDLKASADPEGCRQIIENLLDNAIRHSSAASLVVRAQRLNRTVRIIVRDDGRGIPEAHLERVFERFYRVDSSRSRATGGTGLGLSIVRHWAGVMGGRVWAESRVGEGTAVHLELPAAPTASGPAVDR